MYAGACRNIYVPFCWCLPDVYDHIAEPLPIEGMSAWSKPNLSFVVCPAQPTVTEAHVRRALDLFTVSTMDAVKSGVTEAMVSRSPQHQALVHMSSSIVVVVACMSMCCTLYAHNRA